MDENGPFIDGLPGFTYEKWSIFPSQVAILKRFGGALFPVKPIDQKP